MPSATLPCNYANKTDLGNGLFLVDNIYIYLKVEVSANGWYYCELYYVQGVAAAA